MTSSIKVAVALTLLLAAPVAATASTHDRVRMGRLRAEIRQEFRGAMRGARRARVDAGRVWRGSAMRNRWATRQMYRRAMRDTRRAVRDARRHFWRD